MLCVFGGGGDIRQFGITSSYGATGTKPDTKDNQPHRQGRQHPNSQTAGQGRGGVKIRQSDQWSAPHSCTSPNIKPVCDI